MADIEPGPDERALRDRARSALVSRGVVPKVKLMSWSRRVGGMSGGIAWEAGNRRPGAAVSTGRFSTRITTVVTDLGPDERKRIAHTAPGVVASRMNAV